MSLPVLAITAGDPSGIGPEIAVKAKDDPRVVAACRPVIYGPHTPSALAAFPVGRVNPAAGRAAYDAIVHATTDALAGRVAAVVTAPISKAAFAAAGYPWRGHTDLLAHLCASPDVAMMFWSDRLRVVLATVHIPLREVPSAVSRAKVLDVALAAGLWSPHAAPGPRGPQPARRRRRTDGHRRSRRAGARRRGRAGRGHRCARSVPG